ncbi:MAG: hypothetical protein V4604_08520 [Bacteroidota bacterium]
MKNIAAILIGLIAGVFVIALVQYMGNVMFPGDLPEPEKRAEWPEFMKQLPFMGKLFIVISYGLAGFTAGTIATFIQGRTDFKPTLIICCTIQLFIWMSMISIPQPLWMCIGGTITIIPCGYWAFRKFRIKKEEQQTNP